MLSSASPIEDRWNAEAIEAITGTPWNLTPLPTDEAPPPPELFHHYLKTHAPETAPGCKNPKFALPYVLGLLNPISTDGGTPTGAYDVGL